jgi:hypothetical protein
VTHQRTLPTACPASIAAESPIRGAPSAAAPAAGMIPSIRCPSRRSKPRHARRRADAQISTFSDDR